MLQFFIFNFRYTSLFRATIKNDMKKFKTAMKTMGPAKVEIPSPKDFLKKHSKEKTLPPSRLNHLLFEKLGFLAGNLATIILPSMNIKYTQTTATLPNTEWGLARLGESRSRNRK